MHALLTLFPAVEGREWQATARRKTSLSKADSSDGHVQCTSNVKSEAIGSGTNGDDNVEVRICFQGHLVHHGRFNTSFNTEGGTIEPNQHTIRCSSRGPLAVDKDVHCTTALNGPDALHW